MLWVTMEWFVGLVENALHGTMLYVTPFMTLQPLQGLLRRRRVELSCLEMIDGRLTSSSLVGLVAETLRLM